MAVATLVTVHPLFETKHVLQMRKPQGSWCTPRFPVLAAHALSPSIVAIT